jgi:hypothetical protein
MASSVTSNEQLKANIAIQQYDYDPTASAAVIVTGTSGPTTNDGWLDMRNFENVMVGLFKTVGTNAVTLQLVASSAATGSTYTVVKSASTPGSGQLFETTWLEADVDEFAHLASNLRYVSATVVAETTTDEAVVTILRTTPKRAYTGLTFNRTSSSGVTNP